VLPINRTSYVTHQPKVYTGAKTELEIGLTMPPH
jgi:hypothetical protein